jgi:hypothetical protein
VGDIEVNEAGKYNNFDFEYNKFDFKKFDRTLGHSQTCEKRLLVTPKKIMLTDDRCSEVILRNKGIKENLKAMVARNR